LLATGDDHGNVWLWPHGAAPGSALAHSAVAIGDVAFAERGDALVAGGHDGTVWLWSPATGPPRTANAGADVTAVWTDGTRVVAVDGEGTVHTWHVDGDHLIADRAVATAMKCKRALFASGGAWVVLGGVGGGVTRVEGSAIE